MGDIKYESGFLAILITTTFLSDYGRLHYRLHDRLHWAQLVAKSQAALCHHSYAIIDSGEEKFLPKVHVPLVLLKKTKKVIRVCCPNADELLHSNPVWISSRLLNHERLTTSFTATLHRVMDMHDYCMLQNCFGTNCFTSKNICFRGPHAPNAY